MTDEIRTAGRPRDAATDDAIVEAALAMLRELGPGAVNVAAVAARTGIARTTVYRRYRDRAELLAAALARVTLRGEPPRGLTVAEKLRWVVDRTAEVIDDGIGPGGLAAVLTGSDPEFAAVLRRALEDGLRPIRDEMANDVAAGVLAPGTDADTLVQLVVGSHLGALLLDGTPPDEAARRRTTVLLAALVDAS